MISPISNNYNSPQFGASYHTYFYATDGKKIERIVNEKNMKKCLHYMEAHLNGSKRVKVHNKDLIDNMKFGQKMMDGSRVGGDRDYYYYPKIRAVFDRSKRDKQGYITIVTGKDVDVINNNYGKPIGIAKRESREKTGSVKSFETSLALNRYKQNAPEYAESKAVYKGGKRQAFGIAFTPIYNKKGEVKDFQYKYSGFFNEP